MNNFLSERSDILDEYLSLLQGEDASPDAVFERVSMEHDELVPVLELAHLVRQSLQPSAPDVNFARNSEVRILNQLRARLKISTPRGPGRSISRRRPLRALPSLLGIALVLSMLFGAVGVVNASAASLPGDGLYPLKRRLEQVRLVLSFDPAANAQLLNEFSDERLREIEALTLAGRVDDLEGAVGEYVETVDHLIEASQGAENNSALEAFLGHQVEVLEGVKAQVPVQAQAAIQRAIDRSMQHAQTKYEEDLTQEQEPEEQSDKKEQQEAQKQEREENREQDRVLSRAEQIARQYGVSAEEVLALYQGSCGQDWKCVREHYNPRGKDK